MIEKLLTELGVEYHDVHLYEMAFYHSSYINEHQLNCDDNERLEFLGDAVLELVMSNYLFHNKDHLNEGKMTKLRASYVCEKALYEYSKRLKMNDYIMLGKGEEQSGGKNSAAILSDAFEAFMGAMYLDLGIEKVEEFFLKTIIPIINDKDFDIFTDFKTRLQELIQADKRVISYHVVNERGPAHQREFEVEVKMDQIVLGSGTGRSKKNAEQKAAKEALSKLASQQ